MEKVQVRNTKQKTIILKGLEQLQGHITAEEILDFLKAQKTPVSKATLYRYLNELENSGQIRKYIIKDGQPACYQYVAKDHGCQEHYHLMCQACGQIVHFESQCFRAALEALQLEKNILVDGQRTVFYGHCPSCKEQKK